MRKMPAQRAVEKARVKLKNYCALVNDSGYEGKKGLAYRRS